MTAIHARGTVGSLPNYIKTVPLNCSSGSTRTPLVVPANQMFHELVPSIEAQRGRVTVR
ncbi:MAG: hypothetical protein ACI9MB_002543 [Verrucomicrobiales bacterium]|jgi:hypothetical protein